jgi:hypothetical protein
MINMRRQLLGLGFVAASSLLAMQAANAMTGPQAMSIDGGPLGSLSLSGGADGYGYYLGNAGQGSKEQNAGAALGNAMIELQKSSGLVQFTVEVGANGNETLGALSYNAQGHVAEAATNNYVTGPLYAGYVTLAPSNLPITISAGQLGSLEGYEGSFDWSNPSQFTTLLFYVENAQSRGVNVAYSQGPISATVQFGDGFDSGVANFLQALGSYSFDANNTLSVYYAGNLGRTGPYTFAYGGINTATYGAPAVNSQMVGAYYSYTNGNLNLVPEVQYVYAKPDARYPGGGWVKGTGAFGAALFGTYSLANTPYSLGGWVEYFDSHSGSADNYSWAIGPNAQAIGLALSPTWQYKDLFARANAGYIYLLHHRSGAGTSYGYGTGGSSKGQFMGTLEAGVLF